MITDSRITSTFKINIHETRTPQQVCQQLYWNRFFRRDIRIRSHYGERIKFNPKHFSVFKKTGTYKVVAFEWYQGEVCNYGLDTTWPGIRDQFTVPLRSYEDVAQKVIEAGLVLPPDELAVAILEQHRNDDDLDESCDILAYPHFDGNRERLSVKVFNIQHNSRRNVYEAYLYEGRRYLGKKYHCLHVNDKKSILCLIP